LKKEKKKFVVFRREADYHYGDGLSKLIVVRELESSKTKEQLDKWLGCSDPSYAHTFVREADTEACEALVAKANKNLITQVQNTVAAVRAA
jgi:hypothetical protein